jgi:hypothetical protein
MGHGTDDSNAEVTAFRASKLWTINVCGAAVGGMLTAVIMATIAAIVIWESPVFNNRIIGAVWLLIILVSLWGLFAGNWIASAPYLVELVKGRGLWLQAFFKKVYIPLDDVLDIEESILGTRTVVRLKRRHGLLKSFWISRAYGEQGSALLLEIRKEIARRG